MTSMKVSTRKALSDAILEFLATQDLLTARDIRVALEREVNDAGPDALLALKSQLTADNGWRYYPPNPLARSIHHLLAERFISPGSELHNTQYLPQNADSPIVIVANHLSYADANVIEVLLHCAGHAETANRLAALAGPKVFTSRERRFSSLCFGTVKVPQSAEVASGEASLRERDVALAARQSIEVALGRLREGDVLLLFGEGSRSRSGEMRSLLTGAARYLYLPGTRVLPLGIAGSETLFPVDASAPSPARVVAHLGHPLSAGDLLEQADGDRRVVMDVIGLAVAELLPPKYRGVYGEETAFTTAKIVLQSVRNTAS
jgi:1-acyl-sn-glycerol-3-phosphate acyltransferase